MGDGKFLVGRSMIAQGHDDLWHAKDMEETAIHLSLMPYPTEHRRCFVRLQFGMPCRFEEQQSIESLEKDCGQTVSRPLSAP